MRRSPICTLGKLALLLGVALVSLPEPGSRLARAGTPPPATTPPARLGVAHGEVDGTQATVAIADLAAGAIRAAARPLGAVDHVRGSAVRGRLVPGRGEGHEVALVVAEEPGPRGSTYVGALHRVEGGRSTRLCGGIAKASTPLVLSTGRVLVSRGKDGLDPTDADATRLVLRVDELSVDEVDPATGVARTLLSTRGYQAFLAAVVRPGPREEVAVLLTSPSGAELVLLDPRSASSRLLGRVSPLSRDVSWDGANDALVFARPSADGVQHEIASLDLSGRGERTLWSGQNDHFMPFALPSGLVACSMAGDKGLSFVARTGTPKIRLLSPLGDGSDAVLAASSSWVAVRHSPAVPEPRPPKVVAIDLASSSVVPLHLPADHFVEVLGFAEGGTP